MKKKLSVLAALILCVLVLAACAQQQPDNATPTEAPTPVPTSAMVPITPVPAPTTTFSPILTPTPTPAPTSTPPEAPEASETPTEAPAETPEPTPAPKPTGRTMTVYYPSGAPETVAQYEDGTWMASNGVVYFVGIDGVLRAKGAADLFTYIPSYEPRPEGRTMTVYYANRSVEYVVENGDGTWTATNGGLYYLGDDGILRARGYADLYTYYPPVEPQPAAQTMTVYYGDGYPETVTENPDGTWTASNGVLYYLGDDGILRARGAADLFSYDPSYDSWTAGGMTVYYGDGNPEYVTENPDGTWTASNGVLYYLGDDGILRSRGAADLYTYMPSYNPAYDPSYDPSYDPWSGSGSMTLYDANGNSVTVTQNPDGTWTASNGGLYYEGDDGVFRARGYADLYY